jgi:hypothetical protein
MAVLIIASSDATPAAEALRAGLIGAGIESSVLVSDEQDPEPGSPSRLAEGMRAAERRLLAEPPDAVVVAGDGDEALATALVSTKLRVPTAYLGLEGSAPPGSDAEAVNRRLLELVADVVVGADPVAVAAWLRSASAPS